MKLSVKIWLLLGLFLVFMQIFIGGITRLTGSGLSITKWDIITGTIPPMNNEEWEEAFDLYKETPQYKKINEGIVLKEFKFIFFWEYLHRLWARMMGFVFAIPFVFFIAKGWIKGKLRNQLLILVGLAAVVALFGWIMVASGLSDRPWVNAYKLTWHLSLALIVYGYLAWLVYHAWFPNYHISVTWRSKIQTLFILVIIQIILGGIMSGSKAGIEFSTWPDMRGEWIPSILFDTSYWKIESFISYDKNLFFPALVQILHRTMAYILFIYGVWMASKLIKSSNIHGKRGGKLLIGILSMQVFLGIWTIIECRGLIPVNLGIAHQAMAIVLLSNILWLYYLTRSRK